MNRIGINFNFGNREQPAVDFGLCGVFGGKEAINARVSFVGHDPLFTGQDGLKHVRW